MPVDNVALFPNPPLDLKHAGAVPVTGLTALQGIADHLGVQAGEHVMIHGASGGVGTLAIQFAKARGARVLAIAAGPDGVALVNRLGADAALDGHQENFVKAAFSFAPKGLDAVLVLGSGKSVPRCLEVLRPGGRLAYPNGVDPAPQKRRGFKIIAYDAKVGTREFERLNRAIRKAELNVPIAAEFPLAEAAKAHERVKQGTSSAKLSSESDKDWSLAVRTFASPQKQSCNSLVTSSALAISATDSRCGLFHQALEASQWETRAAAFAHPCSRGSFLGRIIALSIAK